MPSAALPVDPRLAIDPDAKINLLMEFGEPPLLRSASEGVNLSSTSQSFAESAKDSQLLLAQSPTVAIRYLENLNDRTGVFFDLDYIPPGPYISYVLSFSAAGDLNGDGYDDFIIGNIWDDPAYRGNVYVVFGGPHTDFNSLVLADLDGANGFRITGPEIDEFSYLGTSVSSAGDINGDGIDDIVVSASTGDLNPQEFVDDDNTRIGHTYVIFGTTNGFAATISVDDLDGTNGFRISGWEPGQESGRTVSSAGDINNDGFDDIVIGVPRDGDNQGAAYVVFGTGQGFDANMSLENLDGTNGFRISDRNAVRGNNIGEFVANVGDFNGDGIEDIIVSGRSGIQGVQWTGLAEAYVIFGTSNGFASELYLDDLGASGIRIENILNGGGQDVIVSGAGDINGDGVSDIIIGSPGAPDFIQSDRTWPSGRVYIIFGSEAYDGGSFSVSDLDGANGFEIYGEISSRLGESVSSAGDVNGDGIDDVVFSAPSAPDYLDLSSTERFAGQTYILFGNSIGFSATMSVEELLGSTGVTYQGTSRAEGTGLAVSGVGDVNSDGFDDILISNRFSDGYLVFGGIQWPVFGTDLSDTLVGTVGDDIIDGLSGNDDIDGLDGNDILEGGEGDDLIDGNAGIDTASYFSATSGVQVFLWQAGASQNTLGAGLDTLTSIENLSGSTFNDILVGDDSFNILSGDDGDDVLKGLFGNDALKGEDGNDQLVGGYGNDVLRGGNGSDVLIGGVGFDLMFGDAGDDYLKGANGTDRMFGGLGNDVIEGGNQTDYLFGQQGDDILLGDTGDDFLQGNLGDDTLDGGTGNDRLDGANGSDILRGGDGDDLLIGSWGIDTMTGGAGADTFGFRSGHTGRFLGSVDVIKDFNQTDGDLIDLSAIDAIDETAGDDQFSFIGSAAFSGAAGELRTFMTGGNTFLAGDTDGDGTSDFFIMLEGTVPLTSMDLIL